MYQLPKMNLLVFLWSLGAASAQYYDTFTGQPTSQTRVESLRAQNMLPVCAIPVRPCNPHEPRRLDYTCNNLKYPSRGAVYTPYHRMLPPMFSSTGGLRTSKSGNELPNARTLRIGLVTDARKGHKKFTQMITNVALMITGDCTSVHDTANYVAVTRTCCTGEGAAGEANPECIPIRVADDDLFLRASDVRCLNLTRALTYQRLGCAPKSSQRERVNSVAPMLDLSSTYGQAEENAMRAREMSGGRLREEMEGGRVWPPSFKDPITPCFLNQPPNETRCHDGGFAASQTLFGINLMYLQTFRFHNILARRLEVMNPCWDDDKLFYTAREINIAVANQMIYYEWAPLVLGYDYLVKNKIIFPGAQHVDDYDPHIEPRVSIEYVTATRWFHVLQEGRGNMYTKEGKLRGMIPIVDLNLRTGVLPLNNTIEGLTQGSFRQACAAGENTVDPDIGERVLSRLQRVSDVISSDIMKGRDIGLPPYNHYRKLCKLPVAKSFKDLYMWMGRDQADTIATMFETVDDVDVMAGILAEDAMPHALAGPTLACIMADQLLRWRRADRFWYEGIAHPYAHTADQLKAIRETSLAQTLCATADSVDAIQPNPFILPGPGNEIIDCKYYKKLDLEPWRDHKCPPLYLKDQYPSKPKYDDYLNWY